MERIKALINLIEKYTGKKVVLSEQPSTPVEGFKEFPHPKGYNALKFAENPGMETASSGAEVMTEMPSRLVKSRILPGATKMVYSDEKAEEQLYNSKPGEIVKINGTSYVLLGNPYRTTRARNISVDVCELKHVDNNIENGTKKGFGTLTVRAIKTFEKNGNVKPEKRQKLIDIKNGLQNSMNQRVENNHSLIDFKNGEWVAKMQDGNYCKAGDKVLIQFTNGNFPMYIRQVAGSSEGEVLVVRSFSDKKGRRLSPRLILKKL